MVSTRRMAQVEPSRETKARAILNKRPLRKATAKKVQATSATAAKEPVTTSAQMTETIENEPKCTAQSTASAEPKPTRNTRLKSATQTKATASKKPPAKRPIEAKRPNKDKTPSFGAPTQAQMAKRVKSSQPARPSPLSPKKITQVTKSRAKAFTPSNAGEAPTCKLPNKNLATHRVRLRKQAESNENVETIDQADDLANAFKRQNGKPQKQITEAEGQEEEKHVKTTLRDETMFHKDGTDARTTPVSTKISGQDGVSRAGYDPASSRSEEVIVARPVLATTEQDEPTLKKQEHDMTDGHVRQDQISADEEQMVDVDETIVLDEFIDPDVCPKTRSGCLPDRGYAQIQGNSLDGELAKTPRKIDYNEAEQPETIVWENVAQETVSPMSPSLPQDVSGPEKTVTDLGVTNTVTADSVSWSGIENLTASSPSKIMDDAMSAATEKAFNDSNISEKEEIDSNVNFADFIDMGAVATSDTPLAMRGKSSLNLATPTRINWTMVKGAADTIRNSAEHPKRRKSFAVFESETVKKGVKRPFTADGANERVDANFADVALEHSRKASGFSSAKRVSFGQGLSLLEQLPAAPRTPLADRSPNRQIRHIDGTSSAITSRKLQTPDRSMIYRAATSQRKQSASKRRQSLLRMTPLSVHKSRVVQLDTVESPASGDSLPDGQCEAGKISMSTPKLRRAGRHPATIAVTRRFHTPPNAKKVHALSAQRPATLRKVAFSVDTPPMRVPVKFDEPTTPDPIPMTPHPAAPLSGVLALVEVYTLEGASVSAQFATLLQRLGAKTTKSWTDRITHVVFKDGSPGTLRRIRQCNKVAQNDEKGHDILCVNTRWVCDCDAEGLRMDEYDDLYTVDTKELPRNGKRRRQSMEPGVLHNFGGSIIRDRKSSNSLSRTPKGLRASIEKTPEPAGILAGIDAMQTTRSLVDGDSSPDTPAWLHPMNLVQQTAPMNKVRKLKFTGIERRRLSYWPRQLHDES